MLAPAIFASLAMPAFAGKLSKSIAKQQHQNEQSGTEYYKNGSIKSKHGVVIVGRGTAGFYAVRAKESTKN